VCVCEQIVFSRESPDHASVEHHQKVISKHYRVCVQNVHS